MILLTDSKKHFKTVLLNKNLNLEAYMALSLQNKNKNNLWH